MLNNFYGLLRCVTKQSEDEMSKGIEPSHVITAYLTHASFKTIGMSHLRLELMRTRVIKASSSISTVLF